MIPIDEMGAAMAQARDLVLKTCLSHERRVHGGQPCWPNRLSTVAYFMHCLGITTNAWDFEGAKSSLRDFLGDYEIYCKGGDCKHGEDSN